ncbi:MAG TPA: hypothetical protein VFQ00_01965 [Terriglobales bacterium]|nr:hypothetical protein [Terriglobales bacterium]
MRDIHEVIRQKEGDIDRLHREIEALRLAAKLLEESSEVAARPAATTPTPVRETPTYSPAPVPRPVTTPAATPTAWASAKQFP